MSFLGMGIMEILIILIIAFIFLGPERMADAARMLGKMVREARSIAAEVPRVVVEDDDIKIVNGGEKTSLTGQDAPKKTPPPAPPRAAESETNANGSAPKPPPPAPPPAAETDANANGSAPKTAAAETDADADSDAGPVAFSRRRSPEPEAEAEAEAEPSESAERGGR